MGALSRGGASARGNKKGKQNVDSDDSDDDDASTKPKPTPTKTTTPATTTKPKWWHAKTWTFTAQDDEALLGEAADLLFHLLVALRARGLGLVDVANVLAQRHATRAAR